MAQFSKVEIISPVFGDAMQFMLESHRYQVRKFRPVGATADLPYISHLLGVASLAWDLGGDEVQVVAALLHDAVEDAGTTLEEIDVRFGTEVANIVARCSKGYEDTMPLTQRAALVKLADCLHNARSLISLDYSDGAVVAFVRRQQAKYRQVLAQMEPFKLPQWAIAELSVTAEYELEGDDEAIVINNSEKKLLSQ